VTVASRTTPEPSCEPLLSTAGLADLHRIEAPRGRTITKTRVVAGDFHQLPRLDDEPQPEDWSRDADVLAQTVSARVGSFDAVVLADYDKGTLRPPGTACRPRPEEDRPKCVYRRDRSHARYSGNRAGDRQAI